MKLRYAIVAIHGVLFFSVLALFLFVEKRLAHRRQIASCIEDGYPEYECEGILKGCLRDY